MEFHEQGALAARLGRKAPFAVNDGRDRVVEGKLGQVRLPDLGLGTVAVALHVGD
jgi:hypothetical protein